MSTQYPPSAEAPLVLRTADHCPSARELLSRQEGDEVVDHPDVTWLRSGGKPTVRSEQIVGDDGTGTRVRWSSTPYLTIPASPASCSRSVTTSRRSTSSSSSRSHCTTRSQGCPTARSRP